MRKIVVLVFLLTLAGRPSVCQKLKTSDIEKSVVQVGTIRPDGTWQGSGTGFFVREDGIVATAFHVYSVEVQAISENRGGQLAVRRVSRYSNKFVQTGFQLAAIDASHDLALLKVLNVNADAWNTVGGINVLKLSNASEIDLDTNIRATGYFGADLFL